MKTLGLGNALVDLLVQLDNDSVIKSLNFPKGSMQLIEQEEIGSITKMIESLPVMMVSGGSAANTIHGLACLGNECGFIGKVGRDELGRFYDTDLSNAGVKSYILLSNAVTGHAYTLITPDTERTFATFLGAAVEMKSNDLNPEIFADYDLLHIEGYLVQNTDLIKSALQIAKENGLKISLDLASFNVVESNIKFLTHIIPEYVDILFANEEEARAFTGKNPLEAIKMVASQCETAVVKIGKQGSLVRSGNEQVRVTAIPSDVVDTTGAGDQYAAGFLHGFSIGLDLEKCGQLGSLLAGKVIENFGARIKPEFWKDILTEANRIKT